MPFFQPLDRPSATLWVRANPQSPVLRPCNFTETHPHILAVTYLVHGVIYHSLVERVENSFYNVIWNGSLFERTSYQYSSEKALQDALIQFSLFEPPLDDPIPVCRTDRGGVLDAEDPC